MLAWQTDQTGITRLDLEQCRNLPSGCRWHTADQMPGADRETLVEGLHPQHSYCWRVQPWQGNQAGAVSNIVCQ